MSQRVGREQLEAAMGAVLTNPDACHDLGDDAAAFARTFQLSAAERRSLVAMQGDLLALMPGFVSKRRQSLRGSSRRTLTAFGEDGPPALTEYLSGHPPVERLRDDCLALADFLVDDILQTTDGDDDIVADVARFERAIVRTQQHSRPLRSRQPTSVANDPESLDLDRPLRLAAEATVESFDWDLRAVANFRPETLDSQPADPCTLVFFHAGDASGHRAVRVTTPVAPVLRCIAESPGSSAATAIQFCERRSGAINTLSRLIALGGIE